MSQLKLLTNMSLLVLTREIVTLSLTSFKSREVDLPSSQLSNSIIEFDEQFYDVL
jgi:hypothetical protein